MPPKRGRWLFSSGEKKSSMFWLFLLYIYRHCYIYIIYVIYIYVRTLERGIQGGGQCTLLGQRKGTWGVEEWRTVAPNHNQSHPVPARCHFCWQEWQLCGFCAQSCLFVIAEFLNRKRKGGGGGRGGLEEEKERKRSRKGERWKEKNKEKQEKNRKKWFKK